MRRASCVSWYTAMLATRAHRVSQLPKIVDNSARIATPASHRAPPSLGRVAPLDDLVEDLRGVTQAVDLLAQAPPMRPQLLHRTPTGPGLTEQRGQ